MNTLKTREPDTAAPYRIIHQDNHIMVVDKSAGISVNRTTPRGADASVHAVHPALIDLLAEYDVQLVHRIDRETSGLVVFSRDASTQKLLSQAFHDRQVEKRYLALTTRPVAEVCVEQPIGNDARRPRARRIDPQGRAARTEFKTLAHNTSLALIAAQPQTGRTHQIRVHLRYLGAPILGDKMYGGDLALRVAGEILRVERTMLHAHHLSFKLDGKMLHFVADEPDDFLRLRREVTENIPDR